MSYTNRRDRSREAERRAVEVARQKAAAAADARLAENERELARLQGQRDALLGVALADERLREAERLRLAALRGKVVATTVGGEVMLTLVDDHNVSEEEIDAAILASLRA